MGKEIIDRPLIDPHLDSYEKFFDHDWCGRIFEAVKASSLKESVGVLMVAWRSTNGAHLLPWLMVETLRGFAEGKAEGQSECRADYSDYVIKGIVEKIERRMQYSLKLDQRRSLKRVVTKIEEEAFEAFKIAQEQTKFDVAGYWNFLLHTPEFRFCILGTQRVNYGSLFFAYEDFLANVIRTREPLYTSKKDPIKSAFARHFGDPLTDLCWNHDNVDLAKLVRHALAHNGGRFGKDLEKYKARFVDATGMTLPLIRGEMFNVVDGKIQITPCNTTHLFGVLKERVTKIVEELA